MISMVKEANIITVFYLLQIGQKKITKAGQRQVGRNRYPGLALNLSNCSKINRMHVCLNDIAWKASESSYMLDTFSNDIS